MDRSPMLYEKIAGELKAELRAGKLMPGDRVPNIAELRKRYGVSHITVLRAYRELVDARLINRHGHGYAVTGYEKADGGSSGQPHGFTVGLFLRPFRAHSRDDYFNEINLAIEQTLMAANLDILRSFSADSFVTKILNFSESEMLANLESIAARSVGVLLDERAPDSMLLEFMESHQQPAVLVNRWTDLDMSCVAIDDATAINEQVSTLTRLGYERIIYLQLLRGIQKKNRFFPESLSRPLLMRDNIYN